MVQVKLSPRRETLRLRIDRTPSERTSSLCPSPAGEEAAASRAMPVKWVPVEGDPVPTAGKLGRMGKSSRLASTVFAIFAICRLKRPAYSPLAVGSNVYVGGRSTRKRTPPLGAQRN